MDPLVLTGSLRSRRPLQRAWRLLYLARAESVSLTAARATLLVIINAPIGSLLPIPPMRLPAHLVNAYLMRYLIAYQPVWRAN